MIFMRKMMYFKQKLLLAFLMLSGLMGLQAQLVTIPAGNPQGTTGTRRPYGCFFGYERSALLYLQSEINTTGTITSIAFYVDAVNSPATSTPINIYIKTTSAADFGSGTNVVPEFTGTTLVYSGTVTSAELVTGQWVTKTLTTPFAYTGGSNLEILVEANYGGTGGEASSAAKTFRVGNSTGSTYLFQYWYQDNTPPTDNGTTSSNRPNVQLNFTPFVACSGRPTAGNTVASANPACASDSLALSISGTTNTSGLTYQWLSSTNGVNYTNIAGATAATYKTVQNTATYYRNIVTCTNSGQQDTSVALFVGQSVCYCSPTAGCGSNDRIDTVVFAGINNYTSCGANGYTFYSSPVAAVQTGLSYPIRVFVADGGTENVGVWIDYNQNGTFETTEYTDLGTQTGGVFFTSNITIPGNALTGTTRMRVRNKYANTVGLTSADACLSYTYGETEDYLVNIAAGSSCSGSPTAGNTVASANPVCATDNLSLSISGTTSGTGITYQWISSANGINYTNIGAATSSTYSTNQSTATYYRNIVTCTNSGQRDTSTALLVGQLLCYCTPTSSCSSSDAIDTVIFAGINNYSDCDTGYNFYPTPVASVQRGTLVPISVYVTDGGPESVGVWIDYNQNGTFETSEFTDLGTQPNGDVFFNGNVNIPLNALLGTTRMRVRDKYAANSSLTSADACLDYSYGETEDYLVNITAAPTCTTPAEGGTATGPSAGAVDSVYTFVVTGSTGNIQWQYSTSSANGPFTDITGYTDDSLQIVFGGAATFWLRAFVTTPGCEPDSSNVLPVVVTKRGNDVCDAISLVFGANGPYNTTGANTQLGEPSPAGSGCQTQQGWCSDSVITNTLWFKFVAPASGRVRIQAPGFDTQLALWDAANCGAILTGGATLVKANDDDANYSQHGGVSGSSYIDSAICLTPGKTYFVQLDPYDAPGDSTSIILTDLGAGPNASFTNLAQGYCVSAPAVTLTPAVSGGTFSGPGVSGNTFTAATAGIGGPYVITYSLYACYTTSDTVTVNSGPGITPVVTPVSCSGGSNGAIDITVTNGSGNYTYSWSNSQTTQDISGLTAGNYTVSLTDVTSNCTATSNTIAVTQPTPLVPALDGIVNVLCNGASTGAVNITISGGTPPYTYLWSNGSINQDLSNVPAGLYTATVTDDNGCQLVSPQPIPVTQSPAIVITVDSTKANVCGANNGAIYISVAGGAPGYTYAWSNSQTSEDITGLSTTTYGITVTDANLCSVTGSAAVIDDTPLNLSSAITSVSCNGNSDGAIDITVSGGSGSYTYSWSNSSTSQDLSGLAAGSYTVSVDDDNSTCSVTNTFLVTQPAVLVVTNDSFTNVKCNGTATGAVYVSVSGGTTPFGFNWSNSAQTEDLTAIAIGSYSTTVTDANGCTASSAAVVLTEPSVLVLTYDSATNNLCSGQTNGAVYTTISGGTAPYSPVWSNGTTTDDITGLANGTYNLTVTDANSCTVTPVSGTVTSGPAVVATLDSVDNVSCFGLTNGAVYTTVSGGTGALTVTWSNTNTTADITGLAAGTYTATVTDANSCSVSVSGTVTAPASVLGATSVSTDQTQGSSNGAINVTVSGGTPPYTSLWSNSATSEDLSSLAAGIYSVTITDANGCTFNLADTVGVVTGIATLQNSFGVNLYPNPTQDKLFIELSLVTAGNVTVQIYNIEGRLINEFTDKNIVTTRYELNFATQAAGIYLAKIKAGDATVTQRFTVVK